MREVYDMPTDFDVALGTSNPLRVAMYVECTGPESVTVAVTHTNLDFLLDWVVQTIHCGSQYNLNAIFTPSQSGITTDVITLSTPYGVFDEVLIGNGVPAAHPETWIADLGPGSSIGQLAYDAQRDLVYLTDWGNDALIVFSPALRSVINRIPTGALPFGLSITLDGSALYVANTGEHSISRIDLNSQTLVESIPVPTLHPDPTNPEHYNYMPYTIVVVSETLALLGSDPPGNASGGPLYTFDLVNHTVAPRWDLNGGVHIENPWLDRSRDATAAGVIVPEYSPTRVSRYDPAADIFITAESGIMRNVALNNNGTRVVITHHDCNTLRPNLNLFDMEMVHLGNLKLLGCQSVGLAFNPVNPDLLYAVDGRGDPWIEEAGLGLGRQTRALHFTPPAGYYFLQQALVVSGDGEWLFAPLGQTWNAPPARLLAMHVGPTAYTDTAAPATTVEPLAESQSNSWWVLEWVGEDNSSGIDHYEVQFRIGPDGAWIRWVSTAGTQALFTDALPGAQYFFRVIAYDRAGNIEKYPADYDAFTTAGGDGSGLTSLFLPAVSGYLP